MKKIMKMSAYIVIIALSLNAKAEELDNGQTIFKLSTMGAGIEYNHPVSSVLSVGFGINKFSKSDSITESDIDYEGEIDFSSLSVIGNYHPWKNAFRLRFGFYYNNNEIGLVADSVAGDLTIGNTDFVGADINLDGKLTFKKFSPYIGIGYGSEPIGDNNFSFDLDIGIMRSPVQAELTGTCATGNGAANICNTFDAELAQEQNDLTDSADDIDLYPVISAGLSYRF